MSESHLHHFIRKGGALGRPITERRTKAVSRDVRAVIATDIAGLSLLAELAGGRLRDMIQNLDEISDRFSSVLEKDVRIHFNLNLDEDVAILRGLLSGSLENALVACDRLLRTPDATQDLVVRILTGLELEARKIIPSDRIYRGIEERVRHEFLAKGEELATSLGFPIFTFWHEFAEVWASSALRSPTDLRRKLTECHRWLHERDIGQYKIQTRTAKLSLKNCVLDRTFILMPGAIALI
jgi:hypothetical protein